MKNVVSRGIRKVQRGVVGCMGGFLPEPLSRRTTLMTAALAAFVFLAFAHHTAGLVVGLVLMAAVWLSEFLLAFTSTAESSARHSTMSLDYMLLLSIGAGAAYAARSDHLVWVEWMSMALLGITAWLVSSQSFFLAVEPLKAANFEKLPVVGKRPRVQAKFLLKLLWSTFAVVVVLVIASPSPAPWISLVLAFLAFAVTVWNVIGAWIWADKASWRTLRELRRREPLAMMPYGGSAAFHIPMWEEYVQELKVPYFIETLKPGTVEKLAELTDAPIICPPGISAKQVNSVIPPTVRAAFYVHNAAENKGFLQNRKIKSIWVHHGDGDKLASYRAKSGDYDYLFVAGQGAIDRYASHGVEIPTEKFRIIGRPQTESIVVEERHISEIKSPTVLYAPTWHGKKAVENYSSLEFGAEIVRGLIAQNANVIFRPHPASQSSAKYRGLIEDIEQILSEDSKHSDRVHVWGGKAQTEWSVADATNASDAMVSDVSGIVTDYMQSSKPYAMVTLQFTSEEFTKEFPTSRASYVISGTHESLTRALDEMLHDDPLRDDRARARAYYLGGFEGHESTQRFVEESRKIMSI